MIASDFANFHGANNKLLEINIDVPLIYLNPAACARNVHAFIVSLPI